MNRSIDVYITRQELEKLSAYVDFLPVFQYELSDTPACKERGKINILGGPIIRFHLKRTEIPVEDYELNEIIK